LQHNWKKGKIKTPKRDRIKKKNKKKLQKKKKRLFSYVEREPFLQELKKQK